MWSIIHKGKSKVSHHLKFLVKINEMMTLYVSMWHFCFDTYCPVLLGSIHMINHTLWIFPTNEASCSFLHFQGSLPWFIQIFLRKVSKFWNVPSKFQRGNYSQHFHFLNRKRESNIRTETGQKLPDVFSLWVQPLSVANRTYTRTAI